ncbi:hypothetical protein CKO31_25100 [Thiohalocapsa halophila]|uniref:MipA/OmpV family protein n=2 Tax=Thiohalocapsa halophila TaxID=69359 RepID=A0ABS1CPS9_9GAMM|nr:hypothetical protein [Thiohalocapsa halophila]
MRRSLITTSPHASLAAFAFAFAFAVLLSFGLIQSAQQAAADEPGLPLPLLELGIGAAGYHNPSYPGSDVRTTTDFPFSYVISRGDWLRIDRSLQRILYATRRVKADISARSNLQGTAFADRPL